MEENFEDMVERKRMTELLKKSGAVERQSRPFFDVSLFGGTERHVVPTPVDKTNFAMFTEVVDGKPGIFYAEGHPDLDPALELYVSMINKDGYDVPDS
jgi:hypothetical protein